MVDFFKKHPVILNLLLMAVVAVGLIFIALQGLSVLTAHGSVQVVPDVRGAGPVEAMSTLRGCNLHMEVVDSVYNSDMPRGSIVQQVPSAGDRVKPGRTVYLTINAYTAKKLTLPDLVGSSLRQARATLQSLGFTDVREVRVPSDYKDLVLAVKSMGVTLRAGTMLDLNTPVVIEVGEGYDASDYTDTIEALGDEEWSGASSHMSDAADS